MALRAALGGRWHDSYGMTQCPAHDDGRTPALKISDDDRKGDGIDLHCFGSFSMSHAGPPWARDSTEFGCPSSCCTS